jgi:DNA-binding GntR family transcriptional regulator
VSDVQELFELRIALEGTAAELAATKITDAELALLESLKPPPLANNDPDLANFLDYNRKFHLTVAGASRNVRLSILIEQTTEEMGRAIAASYRIGEHAAIIEALRARDPVRARNAMVEHIRGAEFRALHWGATNSSPGVTLEDARLAR